MNKKVVAVGISKMSIGNPGDGVPAPEAELVQLPQPLESSVAFNMAEPSDTPIRVEGQKDPWHVISRITDADSVEFSIPTPTNAVLEMLAGGTHDTASGRDVWKAPTSIPDINKTLVIDTEPYNGQFVRYTFVNTKILARLGQAPGAEQSELLIVRANKQAAVTSDGTVNPSFTREILPFVAPTMAAIGAKAPVSNK